MAETFEVKTVAEARALGRARADIQRRRVGLSEAGFLLQRGRQVDTLPTEVVGKTCCIPARRGETCRHLMALQLLQGKTPAFANEDLEVLAKAEYQVWMSGGYRGPNSAPIELRLAVGRAVAAATGRTFVDYRTLGGQVPWNPEEG